MTDTEIIVIASLAVALCFVWALRWATHDRRD